MKPGLQIKAGHDPLDEFMKKKIALILVLVVTVMYFKKDLLKGCFHTLLLEMGGVSEEEYLQGRKYVVPGHQNIEGWHNHRTKLKGEWSVQTHSNDDPKRESNTFKNPEDIILGFRLDKGFKSKKGNLLTSEDLVAEYGEGCLDGQSKLVEARNYRIKNNIVAKFFFGHTDKKAADWIEIKEEDAPIICKPKIIFESVSTGKGLAINDDIHKLKRLYSNPMYIIGENKQRYYDFAQIDNDKLCYTVRYMDCVMSSKTKEPVWLPPYSAMEVKVCNSRVKAISLYYYID